MSEISRHLDGVAPEDWATAYERLRLIRSFEELAVQLERDGAIRGPLHVALGQEAVAVGACWPLRHDDVVVSTHRGHHHCIAKGIDLERALAELMGRQTGFARGRGGSMHLVAPDAGVIGTNGIVGAGLPIALGAALAFATREGRPGGGVLLRRGRRRFGKLR